MKYLFLLVLTLCFFSCEEESDTKLVRGKYTLNSYEKISGDENGHDLKWNGSEEAGDEMTLSGTLNVSFLGTFKQVLVLRSNALNYETKVDFIGALTHAGGDEWRASWSDALFEEGHCEEADVVVDGDILRWHFYDGDCEIVMEWIKE